MHSSCHVLMRRPGADVILIHASCPLSNSYVCCIKEGDVTFDSMDHYYHYRKLEWFNCLQDKRRRLKAAATAKSTEFHLNVRDGSSRDSWNEIKFQVMKEGLRLKFEQNPPLAEHLLATDTAILMNRNMSAVATEWGISFDKACTVPLEDSLPQRQIGMYDKLGVALEQIRSELRLEKIRKKIRILKPRIPKKTPRGQPPDEAFSEICASDMPATWLDVDDEFWTENELVL